MRADTRAEPDQAGAKPLRGLAQATAAWPSVATSKARVCRTGLRLRRYASHDTNTKDYKRMRKHFAHKRGMELHMAEACLHALKLESGLSRADPQVTASRKNSASKNMHHRMLQRGIHGACRPPSWPITVLGRSSCAARSAALTSASCTSSCGRGAAGGGGAVAETE